MKVNSLTDEELVGQIQKGQTALYEEVMNRYEEKIYRYIKKMTFSHEETQDLVQTTFIKTYVNIQSFNLKMKFSSWLYRIAHNESVNWIKKQKGNYELIDTDTDYYNGENDMYQKLEDEFQNELVIGCIDKLETKYKEVIVLQYLEDKSYEEISDILRKPVATVGTLINRAKSKLKIICEQQKNAKK